MKHKITLLAIALCGISMTLTGQISLPNYFGSNMVLPRNKTIPVKGKSSPGAKLTLSIGNQVHKVKSDASGNWLVNLNSMSAGGPYKLIVEGKDKLVLENILVGDLWLCAGQSNMQYTLDMLGYEEKDSSRREYPKMRLFTVDIAKDFLPQKDIKGGNWKMTNQEEAKHFSATAYFFGRQLVEKQNIPIGLISSNLGATMIETWMSLEALKEFPQFDEITSNLSESNKDSKTINAELETYRKTWDAAHYLKGPGMENGWFSDDFDVSAWKETSLPVYIENLSNPDYDGSFWFRKDFVLDSAQIMDGYKISLNQIDDYDITWINGKKVGETFGNRNFRGYEVPKRILRVGKNSITIRVFDIGGLGGIYTSAFWGNPLLNNGKWHYKEGRAIDAANFPTPDIANGSLFSHPSVLYNANIAPLHDLPISGIIWYQGESNENRAVEYEGLLKSMIGDWRSKWKDDTLPFFIVQLANYREVDQKPTVSNWAELRASQMEASKLSNVDIVTAIDIGEIYDIHPHNKMEVGKRLGQLAMHYNYGKAIKKSPVYKSHMVKKNKIVVTMDSGDFELAVKNKFGFLRGFSIAGKDEVFYWATAFLNKSNKIVVKSNEVKRPKYVRYAWSDNPGQLDLISTNGLPAFPFRTDNLGLSTQNVNFKYDEHSF